MLYEDAAFAEHVLGGLAQEEEEGAVVYPHPACCGGVAEFHVAVVEYPELEPLGNIVHLRRHDREGLVELELGKHVQKGGAFPEALVGFSVLAVDLYHVRKYN